MTPDKEVYKITIDEAYAENGEDLGVQQIAFVKNPAIKVKGFAFNGQQKLMFADTPKMRVTAPALIPMEIYRNDKYGEYYVEFSEEEIEKIFVKFMKNLPTQGAFNTEHNTKKESPAYVLEAWLVDDPEKDKANLLYNLEVPKGTLMMTAQITDAKYFEEIVKNDQTAFSIEGYLGMKMSEHFKKFGEETPDNQNKYATNMKLPEGKHEIDGKIYVVDSDGNIVEVLDKPEGGEKVEEVTMETTEETQETVEETTTEEETKMAEEAVVEEETKEEVKLQIDEIELMTILQPKFDEIYKLIADLKAAMTEEKIEIEMEPIEMSIHQRFSNVMNNYIKK